MRAADAAKREIRPRTPMGVRGLLCRMGLAVGMEQCAYGKWDNGKGEGSVAGAVAAGAGVVLGHLHGVGREELVDREGHAAEQAAGVLLIAAAALRLGDAVVIHRDQQLGVPLQPHQRELS